MGTAEHQIVGVGKLPSFLIPEHGHSWAGGMGPESSEVVGTNPLV